jgi:hypothetical protein
MVKFGGRRATIVLAASAMAALLTSPSAQAAAPVQTAQGPSPKLAGSSVWRWRTALKLGETGDELFGLVAQSRQSAWAFGVRYQRGTLKSAFYLRWQGRHWRPANVPHPRGFVPDSIGSSSSANVWILGSTQPSLGASQVKAYALVFDGSGWRALPAPATGLITVGSPANAWIDAGNSWRRAREASVDTIFFHWNGIRWIQVDAPTLGLGLTVSGRHVWLAGTTKVHFEDGDTFGETRPRLFEFSVGAWHAVSPTGPVAVMATNSISGAVSPSGDAWVLARTARGIGARILQYRYGAWKSVIISRTARYPYGPVSFDGRTGVWWASAHWTGARLISTQNQVQQAALGLSDVAPIPHTASVWALGIAHGRLVLATIALYGPTP